MVARLQRSLRLAAAVPRRRERALVPSILMARPFSTVTHTPHSILPHPRHIVRIRCTPSDDATVPLSCSSASAAGAVADVSASAALVTPASLMKLRRLMVPNDRLCVVFAIAPPLPVPFSPALQRAGRTKASVRTMMQIERELSTPPLMRTLFNQVRNPTIELMKAYHREWYFAIRPPPRYRRIAILTTMLERALSPWGCE